MCRMCELIGVIQCEWWQAGSDFSESAFQAVLIKSASLSELAFSGLCASPTIFETIIKASEVRVACAQFAFAGANPFVKFAETFLQRLQCIRASLEHILLGSEP